MLDADYITACEQRARRFSGAYTGTSGTLAADVMRLLRERKELMDTLDEANKAIRDAVTTRLAGTPADDPKMQGYVPPESCCEGGKCQPTIPCDWILRGERELQGDRLRGDGVLNAGSETYAEWKPEAFRPKTVAQETLDEAMRAVIDRHAKYGPPSEHFARTAALVNAAFGTSFTSSDWALVMVLDKVARLRGPTPTTDGGVDICGYGACYEETRQATP